MSSDGLYCLVKSLNNKVLVRTITYNQSYYITDCMDSVAMQQTNFPFVHCVFDDASTDGEQDVIREWIDCNCDVENVEIIDIPQSIIHIVKHKTNNNCTLAIYFLKENLYKRGSEKSQLYQLWRDQCRYEALCEGDDFWNDSLKLQKQVDWMESHPEYSMCCSSALFKFPTESRLHNSYTEDTDIPVEDMILKGGGIVDTCTILFRTDIRRSYPLACQNGPYGDYPFQIHCSLTGNVRYMNEPMGTYRQWALGSWTVSKIKQGKGKLDVSRLHFFMKFMSALDDESEGKYRNVFEKVRVREMYKVLANYKSQWSEIRLLYPDEVKNFNRIQRREDDLTVRGHFVAATFYGVYHNQGLLRAILTLPIIHDIYNEYVKYRQRNLT